jgi:hypothetical protein
LHADLLENLIKLFHNPETNPHSAQLLINTYNVSLLDDEELYRRDQIYLINKNRYGESSVKPLSAFEGLRKTSKIGKMYKEGRFGAIPYLSMLPSQK